MAEMLRERRRLLEQLHGTGESREEVLNRLRQVEERIKAEERRGPRSYLDHIMERSGQHEEDRG